MKKLFALCFAFIIVGFSISLAQATTQTATITIDGDKTDWASPLTPAVVDAEGNSACGATGDIKSVYTAMDDTNVYFMVETYGTPIESTNTSVNVNFDFKPGQQFLHGFRDDIHINIFLSGISAGVDTDLDGNIENFPIEGAQISWGDVLEVKIPLSQLGNPEYFEPTFVNIWNSDILPQDHESGCNPVTIYPVQGIDYMYVQTRNYENGNTFNRLYFNMHDQSQNPPGDVLATATLLDPNGVEVTIPTPTYSPGNYLFGSYDSNAGQWNFNSGFDNFDNGYSANFDGDLIPGYYRLQVTTVGGWSDERTFKVSLPVDCPIISSSSFRKWTDSSDNLIWEWDPPSIDPSLRTSISAYMAVEGDDDFFWISVPTDVSRITIPKNTFDLLEAKEGKIKVMLFLRINDEFGNNFQRNVSNSVYLDDVGLSSQGIQYMYVQKRNYEDGNTFNRLYFSMYDRNQNPPGDVLDSATLLDPNGVKVTIPIPTYSPVNLLMGNYDSTTGQWNFNSGFNYFDNYYSANFDGDLVPGYYQLQVTTADGSSSQRTFKVSEPVECPIISSLTFRAWNDTSDNLIWEWDPPLIDPSLRTSISAYIGVEGDDDDFFWISVPTNVGSITIPKNTLDLLKAKGDNIKISLSLRINDEFGNNFQRNISNFVYLDDIRIAPPDGGIVMIDYMYVQKRNYESGDIHNRLYFTLNDQNQNPIGDVLDTVTLFDPAGNEVVIPVLDYSPANLLFGHYDTNIGQWQFDSGFDYLDNGYSAKFYGDLVPGDYRIEVTMKNAQFLERTFKVSQPVDCPIISSSSFQAWKDSSGNLIWEWDPPYEINPNLKTRISAYMGIEGDDNFFWITVPTHFGGMMIPKSTLELLEARGDNINIRLFLRVNDEFGNNFQRNASNSISLEDAMVIPPDGDVNNDGKIGLPEAIHALKVTTGSTLPD